MIRNEKQMPKKKFIFDNINFKIIPLKYFLFNLAQILAGPYTSGGSVLLSRERRY